jgi:hypothetical protein
MALQGGDDLHFGRRGRRPVIVHFHLVEERHPAREDRSPSPDVS